MRHIILFINTSRLDQLTANSCTSRDLNSKRASELGSQPPPPTHLVRMLTAAVSILLFFFITIIIYVLGIIIIIIINCANHPLTQKPFLYFLVFAVFLSFCYQSFNRKALLYFSPAFFSFSPCSNFGYRLFFLSFLPWRGQHIKEQGGLLW